MAHRYPGVFGLSCCAHAGIPDAPTRRMETMGMNAEFVARMETQLKKWDADVDALAAESEKASAQARAAYHEQIKGLRANRDAAQKTFQEIRVASESAGEQMQAGMKTAWETMQKALEKMSSDIRK